MSQKTHPTSLRLQKTNKHFLACSYTDFFSSQKSVYDLQIRAYLDCISEQIGHIQISSYTQYHYRRLHLYFFFLDARGVRNAREKSLRLTHKTARNLLTSNASTNFLSANVLQGKSVRSCKSYTFTSKKKVIHLQSKFEPLAFAKRMQVITGRNKQHFSFYDNFSYVFSKPCVSRGSEALAAHKQSSYLHTDVCKHSNTLLTLTNLMHRKYIPETIFHRAIEKLFNFHFFNALTIYPIRVVEDSQFANFLGQEICYFLQRGVSFQQIKDEILSEYMRNPSIKGIRLSCSGRVGGRSKKAQKAKTQSMQWGQTSLHVFSSRLSFAYASVSLPFGKIGIKIWLCYK